MFGIEVDKLKSKSRAVRLGALKKLKADFGASEKGKKESVNLQIHTSYSFSPYTPSLAAFMAYKFSLTVAGILDDYTLEGAREFIQACKILGVTYSAGMQLRCDFGNKRANVALLGVAERYFDKTEKLVEKYRANQKDNLLSTISAINARIEKHGISVSYEKDVVPLMRESGAKVYMSKYAYYATALKIVELLGKGERVAEYVLSDGLELTQNEVGLLRDVTNPYYEYDLAKIFLENDGLLKTKKSYASPEDIVAIGKSVGAVVCYEYATPRRAAPVTDEEKIKGDKALIARLKEYGFNAVSFDPTKFSKDTLAAFVKELEKAELLAINLTKVEFPRRRFDCNRASGTLEKKMVENAFAIVGSEISRNSANGMCFSSPEIKTDFKERVKLFARIGRKDL